MRKAGVITEGSARRGEPRRARVDMHVHSSASHDCAVAPALVARRCARLGLDRVVLTDHDTIHGAEQLAAACGAGAVIVGEEILTTEGDVIGLFLRERVPGRLTPEETVKRIKDQGGLVYLSHPYDDRRHHLSEPALERVADDIDIVEVFNGRADERANRRALDLCEILGAAPGAGSDAHTLDEIGSVYVEMPSFDGPADFLTKLPEGRVVVRPSRLLMLARGLWPSGAAAR